MWRIPVTLLFLLSAPAALAGEDDFLQGFDEDLPAETEDDEDLPEAPSDDDEIPFDFETPDPEEGEDLLDDEEPEPTASDSAAIYRETLERVAGLSPEEEVRVWGRYLERYPDTAFRSRIEDRSEELMESLFARRIGAEEGPVDADRQEIPFSQGLLLENINPRTRLQAGFEFGLPTWLNLFVGYEYALLRNFSIHGAVRNRYTGYNVEAGVRYALIKDPRTQTLLTAIGDVHFNVNPAFLGLRPQLAAGKIFGERLHAQVQLGADLEARRFAGVRLIGGANVTWLPSDNVAIFAETSMNMKNLTWRDGGAFRFNVFSFGLKFFPQLGGDRGQQDLEMNVGASAPYTSNYWMYHFGSIMGQVNYYH